MMSRMSEMTRRDFATVLAALGALANRAGAQTPTAEPLLNTQKVYRYSELPVKTNAAGGESRAVLEGKLPTGELIEVHETVVQPGQMPHPPHYHQHSELILIREGSVEFLNNGKTEPPAGPGDLFFAASLVVHGLKNVGTTPARYFVVAIGPQTPSVYPGGAPK
jgi:quercetin dioxygenase-like cupin family protein